MDTGTARTVIAEYDPREFPRYEQLTRLLQAYAVAFPDLCAVAEIGRSPGGRSIWAATLTQRATGPAADKPGYFVEANIHAGEVTGSAVALHLVHWLLTSYGRAAAATGLLDRHALYVVPRVSVDGAEFHLTTPYWVRSAARLYPWAEEPPGWAEEDVDGDGRILLMRVPDPELGEWRISDRDPRLMVRRHPGDGAGMYYRLLTEGLLLERGAGGLVAAAAMPPGPGAGPAAMPHLRRAPARWGLDFNRNWPAHWHPEGRQPGAGPYPLSEPETRAVAEFVLARPNIGAYIALHTHGGVLLRPPATGDDERLNAADRALYQLVGAMGTRVTGYPVKSTYAAFATDPDTPLVKGADDWAHDHLGLMSFTIECWDLDGRAGARGYAQVGLKGLAALTAAEAEQDELRRLQYSDRAMGGRGFVAWRPFLHPQLGPVEIGGWDFKYCRQNPPPELLPEESARVVGFLVAHAAGMPRLAVAETSAAPVGGGCWKLAARVENQGYLGTSVTQAARDLKAVRPVRVRLQGLDAPGVRLVAGQAEREVGHLPGAAGPHRAGAAAPPPVWAPGEPSANRVWLDWVVQAPAGTELAVTAWSPRAGTARATVRLGSP